MLLLLLHAATASPLFPEVAAAADTAAPLFFLVTARRATISPPFPQFAVSVKTRERGSRFLTAAVLVGDWNGGPRTATARSTAVPTGLLQ